MSRKLTAPETLDPRWKNLYRIGGISSILVAVSIIFAIVAFSIWPFKPGFTSTENIFATLQTDRLGGLMSLDLPFLVTVLVNILPLLAIYAALKQVNESYALIALALGLVAVVALIPSRPLAELVSLATNMPQQPPRQRKFNTWPPERLCMLFSMELHGWCTPSLLASPR